MQEGGGRSSTSTKDWELEVVKTGTLSSKCFWNACKALTFGLLLMFIGTTMATLGYYADQLSVSHEVQANSTVEIRTKSKGFRFHLNNLSYAGPIVMGVGGFIVVAACVMTFEARDSAAKVVPTPRTRQLSSYPARNKSARMQSSMRSGDSRRSTSCQTKWEGRVPSPLGSDQASRRALTMAFVQFSRDLGSRPCVQMGKSPSAPDLAAPPPVCRPQQSLLSPHYLLQRQALSVDNPDYRPGAGYLSPPGRSRQSLELGGGGRGGGSQASMAMDLHLDCPVTLKVRDRTLRAESRRLVRQRQIELEEDPHSWSPRYLSREDVEHPRSTPHSRRSSFVKTPSRGSTDEHRPRISDDMRSRTSSGESVKKRRAREMRGRSSGSRSTSDRSADRASPLEDPCDIIVIEPADS
ncbi:hypothetical protein GE061_003341 [Apolygus lucorum]|uniref:Transmembrane protein 200A n=1 Tax=Apolygus lucorum TaxID=248454 RepID=A0A6A4JKF0_APOLU|nr:hypothetical protein GE061_003341 [Apolygus lucorum]